MAAAEEVTGLTAAVPVGFDFDGIFFVRFGNVDSWVSRRELSNKMNSFTFVSVVLTWL